MPISKPSFVGRKIRVKAPAGKQVFSMPAGFAYTPASKPCTDKFDKISAGRCLVQLTFDKGRPAIRLCTQKNKPGPLVHVESAAEAHAVAERMCREFEAGRAPTEIAPGAGIGRLPRGMPAPGKGMAQAHYSSQALDPRRSVLGQTRARVKLFGQQHVKLGRHLSGQQRVTLGRRFSGQQRVTLNRGRGLKLFGQQHVKLGRAAFSCKRVGKLTAKKKNALPDSAFGLPEERSFPMPDPAHAKNAKARAKQSLKRKHLSREQYNRIVRKADRVISRCAKSRRQPRRKK